MSPEPVPPEPPRKTPGAPAPAPPAPVIVLIEDEPQIRRFLRATLGSHGYRLHEATPGKTASSRLPRGSPTW